MWVYDTLFQPVMRLREKVRSAERVIRRWDTAQTPLARLLATKAGTPEARQRVQQLQRDQNPRAVRPAISRDVARLLGQPVARIAWDQLREGWYDGCRGDRWTARTRWQETGIACRARAHMSPRPDDGSQPETRCGASARNIVK